MLQHIINLFFSRYKMTYSKKIFLKKYQTFKSHLILSKGSFDINHSFYSVTKKNAWYELFKIFDLKGNFYIFFMVWRTYLKKNFFKLWINFYIFFDSTIWLIGFSFIELFFFINGYSLFQNNSHKIRILQFEKILFLLISNENLSKLWYYLMYFMLRYSLVLIV